MDNDLGNKFVKLIDENGNGKIDLIDFVIKALRLPGINVNREEYLNNAFKKYCDEATIDKAVASTPMKAGIRTDIIEQVAKESISLQKKIATASSVGLGTVPGELAVDAATTVADLAQYYGQLLSIMQKIMYLYGYPELNLQKENGSIDDGTMNLIVIGLGAMAGVKEATAFIGKMTSMLAENAPKQILKTGFSTKLAYQISKKVLKFFGIKLTKDVATKGISNAIKFVGGLLMGGITFVTFGSACKNFLNAIKESLIDIPASIGQANVIDVEISSEELDEEFRKDISIEDEEDGDE